MSVQSNSGSGGGSLEATPSWSQLSSSPTISQQHITATAKSKEGTVAVVVQCATDCCRSHSVSFVDEVDYCGHFELMLAEVKIDVKFTDAVNWKPNVSCQSS